MKGKAAQTFEELLIYQRARELTNAVYAACRGAAFQHDRGLVDQVRRAAVSVMSNIAEGFERGAKPEFIQFLFIAKGSCCPAGFGASASFSDLLRATGGSHVRGAGNKRAAEPYLLRREPLARFGRSLNSSIWAMEMVRQSVVVRWPLSSRIFWVAMTALLSPTMTMPGSTMSWVVLFTSRMRKGRNG